MAEVTILSLGGSIVVPGAVDTEFVARFVVAMNAYLDEDPERRLVVVIGGGATARAYQEAARALDPAIDAGTLDEIGIAATRVNAAVVKAAFGRVCTDPVFTDPTQLLPTGSRVVVGGGWKPGFSTDNVAVRAAETCGARRLINLSNISRIYTADPKTHPDARPLDRISWTELFEIVGDEWVPGKNTPFDPIATRRAAELRMTVIAADGRDLDNLRRLLGGQTFVGTTISPG